MSNKNIPLAYLVRLTAERELRAEWLREQVEIEKARLRRRAKVVWFLRRLISWRPI